MQAAARPFPSKAVAAPLASPYPAAMTDRLIITLVQCGQTMGDLAHNADAMLQARAEAQDCDLVVFPELQLIGYPPEDLVLKPALIARAQAELERMAAATADGGPAMLVGSVFQCEGALYNGIALLDGGQIAAVRLKRELPNYGTFDEKRLFASATLQSPVRRSPTGGSTTPTTPSATWAIRRSSRRTTPGPTCAWRRRGWSVPCSSSTDWPTTTWWLPTRCNCPRPCWRPAGPTGCCRSPG